MKVRRLVLPVHTGSIWGLPTKILALIVAPITATLPVTGVVIWVGRKFKNGKKVRKSPAVKRQTARTGATAS
jgi:uncharacterized iron-regulated membrane protein